MSKIGIDAGCGIAHQRGEIVRGDRVAAFHDQVRLRAQTATQQVVVNARNGQQGRHRHFAFAYSIGDRKDAHAIAHQLFGLFAQAIHGICQRVFVIGPSFVGRIDLRPLEALLIHGGERFEGIAGKQRRIESHQAAVRASVFEQVAVVAEIEQRGGEVRFAQRVDRGIRDLREELVEVMEKAARMFR